MDRTADLERKTKETGISIRLTLDGGGRYDIQTGIPFFDHMLALFCVHGFFDLTLKAQGDIAVDCHHTVEDVGLVLGDALNQALGDRKGIRRYGHAVTPMDDALGTVALDLSNRPFLVYRVPEIPAQQGSPFDLMLAKEFFRAFATRGGLNLHIDVPYGENQHHIIEAVFKSLGRSLNAACRLDPRISDVRSSKGSL
ncbi:MAG: imidazoleglycerol-phosphate dehydratase HisB [Desulfobacterales bacterium]|jgi:imidazoleglycerol-phosphate dehydratase